MRTGPCRGSHSSQGPGLPQLCVLCGGVWNVQVWWSWNCLPANLQESCSLQGRVWRAQCGEKLGGVRLETRDYLRSLLSYRETSWMCVFCKAEAGVKEQRGKCRENIQEEDPQTLCDRWICGGWRSRKNLEWLVLGLDISPSVVPSPTQKIVKESMS